MREIAFVAEHQPLCQLDVPDLDIQSRIGGKGCFAVVGIIHYYPLDQPMGIGLAGYTGLQQGQKGCPVVGDGAEAHARQRGGLRWRRDLAVAFTTHRLW